MKRPSHRNISVSYSQILRTIGAYVDNARLSNIRIIETDEGLILQGIVMDGERMGQHDTYQLTTDDVENLIYDAFAKRGTKI